MLTSLKSAARTQIEQLLCFRRKRTGDHRAPMGAAPSSSCRLFTYVWPCALSSEERPQNAVLAPCPGCTNELPIELIARMATHLKLRDLIQFRCICKQWCNAVSLACRDDLRTRLCVQAALQLDDDERVSDANLLARIDSKRCLYVNELCRCFLGEECDMLLPMRVSPVKGILRHVCIMHGADFDADWARLEVARMRCEITARWQDREDLVWRILKTELSRVKMRGLTSKRKQIASLDALVQAARSVPLPEFTVACCVLWNSYAYDDNGSQRVRERVKNGEYASRLSEQAHACLWDEICRWRLLILKAIPCAVESKWSRRPFSALRVKPDRSSDVGRAVYIHSSAVSLSM